MALLRLPLSGSSHRFHSDANSGVVERTGILGVDIAHKTVGRTYYTVVQVLFDDRLPDGDDSILWAPMVAEITRPADLSLLGMGRSQVGGHGAEPTDTSTDTAPAATTAPTDENASEPEVASEMTSGSQPAESAIDGSRVEETDTDRDDSGDGDEPVVVATALFDHYDLRRKLHEERKGGVDETHGILVLDGGELPDRHIRFAFLPFSVRLTAGMDLRVYRTTVEELTEKVEDAFAHGRVNEADRRNMLISIEQHYPLGQES